MVWTVSNSRQAVYCVRTYMVRLPEMRRATGWFVFSRFVLVGDVNSRLEAISKTTATTARCNFLMKSGFLNGICKTIRVRITYSH